jgi:antitoxin VapB
MARNIRNPEAELLAAELARGMRPEQTECLANALERIAEHCAQLPLLDCRTAEEILGYDESGLPR